MYITGSDTVSIPLGSIFGTANATRFSTTAQLDLNPGNSYTGTVNAICADYTNITTRGAGNVKEKVQIQFQNVIPDQVQVFVNGTQWERVRDLFDVDSTSQVYQIRLNEDETSYIIFGDGVYGQRVPADSQIFVNVFYGGGTIGNGIVVGAVNRLLDSFTNSANIKYIGNTSVTSGGNARASISSIREALPGQQRQVAGLVNKQDIPNTLKRSLPWLADAIVSRGFNNVGGIAIPTATVVALPYSSDVTSMNGTQQNALSALLSARGELGVNWTSSSARKAPLALYGKVKLVNKNLQSQKDAEIKKALNATSGSSPFVFDGLGFNVERTSQELENNISSVEGVAYCQIDKLYAIPFALSVSGTAATTASFLDIEIDSDSEDGYYEFNAVNTTAASGNFFLPFNPDQLSTNFARDTSRDFTVETYSYGSASTNTFLNDNAAVGPFISGGFTTQKLTLNQTNTVWETNQFSGTTWRDKFILGVEYTENSTIKKYYYHIMSNSFNTIYTSEIASAPINGGVGISGSLSSSAISNLKYTIYRDMSNMSTGSLITSNGQTMNVVYNNENTLFFTTTDALSKVPTGEYSHVKFSEPILTASATRLPYFSARNALKIITSGSLVSSDLIRVYTTPLNTAKLSYKYYTYVYTLADTDIRLTYI